MAVALSVLPLPEARSFRLDEAHRRRLQQLSNRLGVNQTQALNEAITHLLGTIERDEPVWRTVPSEPQVTPSGEEADPHG